MQIDLLEDTFNKLISNLSTSFKFYTNKSKSRLTKTNKSNNYN